MCLFLDFQETHSTLLKACDSHAYRSNINSHIANHFSKKKVCSLPKEDSCQTCALIVLNDTEMAHKIDAVSAVYYKVLFARKQPNLPLPLIPKLSSPVDVDSQFSARHSFHQLRNANLHPPSISKHSSPTDSQLSARHSFRQSHNEVDAVDIASRGFWESVRCRLRELHVKTYASFGRGHGRRTKKSRLARKVYDILDRERTYLLLLEDELSGGVTPLQFARELDDVLGVEGLHLNFSGTSSSIPERPEIVVKNVDDYLRKAVVYLEFFVAVESWSKGDDHVKSMIELRIVTTMCDTATARLEKSYNVLFEGNSCAATIALAKANFEVEMTRHTALCNKADELLKGFGARSALQSLDMKAGNMLLSEHLPSDSTSEVEREVWLSEADQIIRDAKAFESDTRISQNSQQFISDAQLKHICAYLMCPIFERTPREFKKCRFCNVRYCSDKCYKLAWPTHKTFCTKYIKSKSTKQRVTKLHKCTHALCANMESRKNGFLRCGLCSSRYCSFKCAKKDWGSHKKTHKSHTI